MSTGLHVAHLRARRGGKHVVCVCTARDRAHGRPAMKGRAACVSLLGECHPLAVIACRRKRLTWHVREEAGRHDGKASFLSKGNNWLVINQVQTQKDAPTIEVTCVDVDN